jgi:nucleotide-binding universal stress UspA family protein
VGAAALLAKEELTMTSPAQDSAQGVGGPPALIVVGLDDTSQSEAALAFAVAEARRTGDRVRVVTAWAVRPPAMEDPAKLDRGVVVTGEDLRARAERAQEQALADVNTDGVDLSREFVEGAAGRVLVELSHEARLLVVGSRALGPLRAALLGSVSRYVAQHAACPVVVVPSRVDAQGDPVPDAPDDTQAGTPATASEASSPTSHA